MHNTYVTDAIQADQQYHEEFNPPPEGSATGLGKQEKVIPVTEPAYTQEQLQNRCRLGLNLASS